jgi:hypothetical protein
MRWESGIWGHFYTGWVFLVFAFLFYFRIRLLDEFDEVSEEQSITLSFIPPMNKLDTWIVVAATVAAHVLRVKDRRTIPCLLIFRCVP